MATFSNVLVAVVSMVTSEALLSSTSSSQLRGLNDCHKGSTEWAEKTEDGESSTEEDDAYVNSSKTYRTTLAELENISFSSL